MNQQNPQVKQNWTGKESEEQLLGCFLFVEYGPSIVAVNRITSDCEGSWPKQGVLDGFYWSSKLGSGTLTPLNSLCHKEIHELGDQLKLPLPVLNPDSCW